MTINNNPLHFEKLHSGEQEQLLKKTIEIRYTKIENIFKQGEFATKAIFIKSGYVKLYNDYKTITRAFCLLPAGNFGGLPSVITQPKYLYSMSAFPGTEVYQTDIEIIRDLFRNNGHFAYELMEKVNITLINYHLDRIFSSCPGSSMSKLVRSLLFLSDRVFLSEKFDMLLTRVELSQFSGISRENTIRALTSLHKEGLIEMKGRTISIINREALELLCFKNGSV
jgi:CRP/FNR family transcriptional regulator, polysaccharide utilization system transcription regulator